MTPDEWARRNRVYPPTAGVPGPREPSLTPYVIAPMRAVHGRTHKRVVFVCGAQMGKSDGMLDIIGTAYGCIAYSVIVSWPHQAVFTGTMSAELS